MNELRMTIYSVSDWVRRGHHEAQGTLGCGQGVCCECHMAWVCHLQLLGTSGDMDFDIGTPQGRK